MTLLVGSTTPAPTEPAPPVAAPDVGPSRFPESRHLHLPALAISFVVCALLLLAVRQSNGDWENARMAALITYNLLGVIAGTLLYVSWRLNQDPVAGWVSVGTLAISLSELPFMLMGFVESPPRVPPGGELQELVVLWAVCLFSARARHRAEFTLFGPFGWGILAAVAFGLLRAVTLPWNEALLAPTAPLGVLQRVLGGVLLVLTLRNLWALDLPRRIRLALMVVSWSTGVFALTDTGGDLIPAAWISALTLLCLLLLAEVQVEAGLWLTLAALTRRQEQLTQLAVRAAAAQELAARENAVLDAVRSAVVPLAQASGVLRTDESIPAERRELLAAAMRREIDRINRTLGGGGSEPRAFGVDDVIGPLAEFHQAQGHHVVWSPSGLQAVHDPDTVARAVGVCLGTVAAAAGGRAVLVQAMAPRGPHDPMTVAVFPHGLPSAALSSRFLQEELARFGTGPTPESVSLHSVERLLQSHGGGLRVLVPDQSGANAEDSFGLELSLPFRPSGRNLPIPR